MKIRMFSGVFLTIAIVFVLIMGGYVLQFSLMAVSLIGIHEFFRAVNGKNPVAEYMGYVACILYYLLLNLNIPYFYIMYIILLVIGFSILMVVKYPKYHINMIASSVFALLYIPLLFSTIYLLYISENGIFFVLLIFLTAFATDTFAYFAGVLFGKRKLAPILSPKKTIEGSIGGVLGTVILCSIYGLLLNQFNLINQNVVFECAMIGFFASIIAQFGDLTASAIKRFEDIKDYSKLIPGHGGILDRFDSILFTSGAIFILYTIFFR